MKLSPSNKPRSDLPPWTSYSGFNWSRPFCRCSFLLQASLARLPGTLLRITFMHPPCSLCFVTWVLLLLKCAPSPPPAWILFCRPSFSYHWITFNSKVLVRTFFFFLNLNLILNTKNILYWCIAGEESWAPKNWCFWTVVLEKTLESPLDCKKIQPVHPKGDQSWGVHWKDWCWSWNSSTLATSCEELTHWKRP